MTGGSDRVAGWLRRDIAPMLSPETRRRAVALRHTAGRVAIRPRWGNLKRSEPFSDVYGSDRGTPADRRYLRAFVQANEAAVTGAVLEVQRDEWTSVAVAAGGGPVSSLEIIDIDPANVEASLVADLAGSDPFGSRRFECEIVLQTLQYLPDPGRAVCNLYGALVPGGTLLLSVPAIARVDDMRGPEGDLWHMTPAGLQELITRKLPDALTQVRGYGSLAVAAGFLYGISAEEMPQAYERDDRRFPIVACAVVQKPSP